MTQPETKAQFDLSGGNLALDFVNTVSNRPTAEPIERLTDYNQLVFFGMQSGVYPHGFPTHLFATSGRMPGVATNVLHKAIQFREHLFAIFAGVVEHRAIPGNPLAHLTFMLQESTGRGRLVYAQRKFVWEWPAMNEDLSSVLWPVARAAADLLLSDEISHLRMCGADDCAWLFLDKTKNQRRRWCDMKTCGNRVKARRHYQRLKAR